MTAPTYQQLRAAIERAGYAFFDRGDYNLNLVGVRAGSRQAGSFDDHIAVAFRQAGVPVVLWLQATTDPGRDYLHSPINANGAAILKPGQYRSLWQIGLHRSRYSALVQRGPCTVWRDANRDAQLDDGPTEETGYFGINLHHARAQGATESPDEWSAGCQVLRDAEEFRLVMALAELAAARHSNSFTYTLIREGDMA